MGDIGLPSIVVQPDWHLGVVIKREQKLVAVDTAMLVIPERVSPSPAGERGVRSYLLLVGDGGFGLAVDALVSTELIQTEAVRWRIGLGKRPWLAGTMIDRLSVLLDVNGLLGMIHDR